MFKRLKDCFTCRSNSVKIKSSCFARSSCCKDANINVDIDGDNKPDINIKRIDSDEIEITMIKEKEEPKNEK
jgi:hypothetical protein